MKHFVLSLFALSLFASGLFAQPTPQPDPTFTMGADEKARVEAIGVKSLRAALKIAVRKEKRRLFNKDEKKIEAMEVLLEDDELLEIWISERTDEFIEVNGTSTQELGDGKLLEMWLEFLGSDNFKKFLDTLIPAIEKLIEIISKLAVLEFHQHHVSIVWGHC